MAVPSSGQLRLRADIALEVDGSATNNNVSLNALSAEAGFTAPNGMEEFYGYTSAVAPSVTTNAASSVTTNSMVLNGNVTADGGATVTSRGFYFGTSSTYSNNAKYTVGSGTGVFSTTRTGLAQNTTYYITAFAINSAGEAIGSTVGQTTLFNYTFAPNMIGSEQLYPPTRVYSYYLSAANNSSWLASFNGVGSNVCGNICTNRRDLTYSVITSNNNQGGTTIFYTYYAQCGGGSIAISNHAGYGGAFYYSNYSNAARVAYAWSAPNYNPGGAGGMTFDP